MHIVPSVAQSIQFLNSCIIKKTAFSTCRKTKISKLLHGTPITKRVYFIIKNYIYDMS